MIHSLGVFKKHSLSIISKESQDIEGNDVKVLARLDECEVHQLPIEFYCEEEIPDDAKLEFASVIYGCLKC